MLVDMSKAVFLIGAGASKDAGLPIIKDFYDIDYFNSMYGFKPVSKGSVDELISICKEINKNGNSFEELILDVYESGNNEQYEKLLYFYEKVFLLSETFAGSNVRSENQSSSWYYGPFVNILKRDFVRPTIITFNHDLFIENYLMWENFNYGKQINQMYPLFNIHILPDNKEGIKILKMHGSFNHCVCDECGKIGVMNDYAWQYKGESCSNCNKGKLKPYYVPPLKKKDYSYYENTWQEAKDALKNATFLFVIGYSMPPYDLSAKELLQENLNEKATVIVIDKFAGSVIENYKFIKSEKRYYIPAPFSQMLTSWHGYGTLGIVDGCKRQYHF